MPPEESSTIIDNRVARISFVGAKNDLLPFLHSIRYATDVHETLGELTITPFPLADAAECNVEMTECRHAAISTVLKATYQVQADGSLAISGNLYSSMGRTATYEGIYFRSEARVPDSVPIIDEREEVKSVDAILHSGKSLEINGLAGVKVIVAAY